MDFKMAELANKNGLKHQYCETQKIMTFHNK